MCAHNHHTDTPCTAVNTYDTATNPSGVERTLNISTNLGGRRSCRRAESSGGYLPIGQHPDNVVIHYID